MAYYTQSTILTKLRSRINTSLCCSVPNHYFVHTKPSESALKSPSYCTLGAYRSMQQQLSDAIESLCTFPREIKHAYLFLFHRSSTQLTAYIGDGTRVENIPLLSQPCIQPFAWLPRQCTQQLESFYVSSGRPSEQHQGHPSRRRPGCTSAQYLPFHINCIRTSCSICTSKNDVVVPFERLWMQLGHCL